jgi:hypothetical protein
MSIDIARKYQDIIDWDLLSGNTENDLITFIDIMNNNDLPWNYNEYNMMNIFNEYCMKKEQEIYFVKNIQNEFLEKY